MAAPDPEVRAPPGPGLPQSFLQARCQEPIMPSDWGLPLLIALLVLGLVYAFLYIPASLHHALLREALANQSAAQRKGD